MIKLYFDGACIPRNPGGVATFGYRIVTDSAQENFHGFGVVGEGRGMTNNVAEYEGMYNGLLKVKERCIPRSVIVYGDSKLALYMVAGWWGKRKPHKSFPHLLERLNKIKRLIVEMMKLGFMFNYEWIPREENEFCDELSEWAYKTYRLSKRELRKLS